ncbi:FG-GAP-like repeat-containing protein [Opitutus sp. GAS368]|uniref:FG-GAP-like repeat-containing protein n=1 Tax=Opitutus sp. GAS368 TaxID=1882749 RepID=UPI0031B5D3C9
MPSTVGFLGPKSGSIWFGTGHRRSGWRAAARLIARCPLVVVMLLIPLMVRAGDAAGGLASRPLNPPSSPRGKTMFVELAPEVTGVRTENRYDDPRMFGDLFQEFEAGSVGTGVAVGDFDGDGRPDIFVVSKTESCRLFRNLGHYKFEDVTDKAGVGDKGEAAKVWKSGVTFVDVNNDGLLDIYVCRFNAPNLLYINQGDGTFKEEAHAYGLDVKDASVMAAFCDYDRDGWLDVYITTNLLTTAGGAQGRRGYLFHNNRDGTFTDVTGPAGITGEARSHSATWWDYDNDGWPDLYVANDYGAPDKLYHNNRDGTFTDTAGQFLPHTAFSSMGADFGDVNNDGLTDFFVADMAGTSHEKDQHMMADARSRTDERPDDATGTPKYRRNALLLGTGTGYCQEAGFLAGVAATDWTWSARLEDLDNDGHLDLFVTNGFLRDSGVDVVKRQMSAESEAERIRLMLATPVWAENHIALRNLGDLQFENVSAAWGLDQKSISFGAAFGDLNGDGNLDLVYSNYHKGVTLLRNDNDTGHRIMIDLRGTVSNRFGVGATVRIESALGVQVRTLGLARGYLSSSEPAIHFGLGEDTVIKRMVVTWPSGHEQTWENLAVDRRYTITEPAGPAPARPAAVGPAACAQFAEVSRGLGLDLRSREDSVNEASVQRLVPFRFNRRGPSLAVGKVAGTDRDEVVIGGTTLDATRIIRDAEAGRFAVSNATGATPGTADDGPVLLFDADGDGNEDLLVTRGGNSLPAGMPDYQPVLYLGDGHGGFRAAPDDALPPLPINAGAVAAADFDRDGRLDLFIGGRILPGQYPRAPQSALLANRGGKFEDVTDTVAPGLREVGMVTAALWSDVDGDGWPDLLVATEWGNVKYFHNDQGRRFEDWTERAGFATAGTGWWTSLASADFNGDGRPDYVVGNVGLNTQYHADAAHPALIFSGDFKGNGSSQLIEAYHEGDRLYPWRALRDLGAVFPSLLKRYPQNENYARATLAEIFGEDRLARAQRFAATEFRSGVFLSQPDGTYRFEPLPRIAQIAPMQGVVAGDFDGDGHADIYAVQNSYSPIAAVGRFDGGLSQLLRGDGHGHFTPAPAAESGLIVPGDAKALVVLDLDHDGWPDFLVSRNNDETLAFRNNGVAGRKSVRVELRGPPGNPTAVGAAITVELADGTTQSSEVAAGSGYYSQSSAACFFGYPENNPPREIRVRWPSGATTRHPFAGGSSSVVLTAPASVR